MIQPITTWRLKPTPVESLCGLRSNQSDLWDNAIGFAGCFSSLGFHETPAQRQVLVY